MNYKNCQRLVTVSIGCFEALLQKVLAQRNNNNVTADKIARASSDSQGQEPLNLHNLPLIFLYTFIKSALQYCLTQIVNNIIILGLIGAFVVLRVKPAILLHFT